MSFDASAFVDKVRKHAGRSGNKLIDVGVVGMVLTQSPDVVQGIKLLGTIYGKPVVRASLIALAETALEE